jgi:hypothetical protein
MSSRLAPPPRPSSSAFWRRKKSTTCSVPCVWRARGGVCFACVSRACVCRHAGGGGKGGAGGGCYACMTAPQSYTHTVVTARNAPHARRPQPPRHWMWPRPQHTHTHTHTHPHTHPHTHTHTHTHPHPPTHTHSPTPTHTLTHSHTPTSTPTHTHIHTHTHPHPHPPTPTHPHTHASAHLLVLGPECVAHFEQQVCQPRCVEELAQLRNKDLELVHKGLRVVRVCRGGVCVCVRSGQAPLGWATAKGRCRCARHEACTRAACTPQRMHAHMHAGSACAAIAAITAAESPLTDNALQHGLSRHEVFRPRIAVQLVLQRMLDLLLQVLRWQHQGAAGVVLHAVVLSGVRCCVLSSVSVLRCCRCQAACQATHEQPRACMCAASGLTCGMSLR